MYQISVFAPDQIHTLLINERMVPQKPVACDSKSACILVCFCSCFVCCLNTQFTHNSLLYCTSKMSLWPTWPNARRRGPRDWQKISIYRWSDFFHQQQCLLKTSSYYCSLKNNCQSPIDIQPILYSWKPVCIKPSQLINLILSINNRRFISLSSQKLNSDDLGTRKHKEGADFNPKHSQPGCLFINLPEDSTKIHSRSYRLEPNPHPQNRGEGVGLSSTKQLRVFLFFQGQIFTKIRF